MAMRPKRRDIKAIRRRVDYSETIGNCVPATHLLFQHRVESLLDWERDFKKAAPKGWTLKKHVKKMSLLTEPKKTKRLSQLVPSVRLPKGRRKKERVKRKLFSFAKGAKKRAKKAIAA